VAELSEERAARNEIAFRDANDAIDDRRNELGVGGATPYLCECEDPGCTELVRLTRPQYEEVRSDPRRFFIATGHSTRGTIVSDHAAYLVVEKEGVAGELAENAE
jgi:hypothetical protein